MIMLSCCMVRKLFEGEGHFVQLVNAGTIQGWEVCEEVWYFPLLKVIIISTPVGVGYHIRTVLAYTPRP